MMWPRFAGHSRRPFGIFEHFAANCGAPPSAKSLLSAYPITLGQTGRCVMDFMPYALAYLNRVFVAGDEPVPARLSRYVEGWKPITTEQFLAQDFVSLNAPGAPALVDGFVKSHVRTLAMTRLPGQFLVAFVHAPSLLRREIGFEIGIVCDQSGIVSAVLDADPAHHSELSLFLLTMGSLETLRRVLPRLSGN